MSAGRAPDPKALARKAVQVELALLRTPLVLTDRVASRFGAGAVRSTVRQGLAVLDALADAVRDRSTASARTEAPASQDAPEPSADGEPGAEEELIEQVTEELLDQDELTPHAGELADDDELRRVQAELNAKRLVEEQEEQRPTD